MALSTPRKYEIIDGYSRRGDLAFVVRIVGKPDAAGYVCSTWGKSTADEREVRKLVEQANRVNGDGSIRE
jgi:hypothetical protein